MLNSLLPGNYLEIGYIAITQKKLTIEKWR